MRRPEPKKTTETWHLYPMPNISAAVKKMASSEMRSVRNMVMVLLKEALAAREQLKVNTSR